MIEIIRLGFSLESDDPSMNWIQMHIFHRFLIAFCLLMVNGCSHEPSRPPPDEIQAELDHFGAKASYQPTALTKGPEVTEQWKNGSRTLDILFVAPEEPGSYPLVVYLPGLGQDAGSAPLWRDAWVKGGFAVLVVQQQRDAMALTHLSAADRHDLKSIGHEHFSLNSLEGRISDVTYAIRNLEERKRTAKPPFSQARMDEIAIVGFDLGAQTLQAMLGEAVKGLSLREPLPPIQAALLLSPHVDMAKGGIHHRFESLNTPLLVVTGSDDHDPWGITSPSVRSAPWQQAHAGSKILLNLINGTHRQLAGIDPQSEKPEDQEEDPDEVRHAEEEGQLFGKRGRGGPNGRATQFGDARRGFGPGYDPRHYGRQLAAIQKISTAFLGSVLRKDKAAENWLRNEAPGWLGSAGQLKFR